MLQLISIVLVIYSYFIIQLHLPKLPRCIPTHFNAAGVADGWGSPEVLWYLLGAQALTCALFLIVPYVSTRAPSLVHFGSRRLTDFGPVQRARMLTMLKDMPAYLSIVMNVFFVFMLHEVIRAATQPSPRIHPLLPLVFLITGMVGITAFYMWQFSRVARDKGDRDPSAGVP